MSEAYIAIILGGLGLMYFLIKLGLNLGKGSKEYKEGVASQPHGEIRLFFIWMALILFYPLANLMIEISSAATLAADITTMMTTIYYVAGFVVIVSSFYFGIYFIRWVYQWMVGGMKNPNRNRA